MKKFIATLLAVALIMTLCASALAESRLDKILEAGEIHMATSPDFAPSEFIDDSKTGQDMYVGADIELGKYIAEKLGVKLVIDAMDFSAVMASVALGSTDMAISGFAYTEERAEMAEMSTPYNISDDEDSQGHRVLMLKEVAESYDSADDFAGLTLAVQNGSLQQQLATAQLPEDVKYELISDLGTAVLMLTNGKVDGVVVANGEIYETAYPEVKMSTFRFEYEGDGTVMMVPKGETELMEAINEIIVEVNEKGLYDEWVEEYTALAASLGIEVND